MPGWTRTSWCLGPGWRLRAGRAVAAAGGLGTRVRSNHEWESFGLTYGNPVAPFGPWVMVASSIGYAREPDKKKKFFFFLKKKKKKKKKKQRCSAPSTRNTPGYPTRMRRNPPSRQRTRGAELTVGDRPVSAVVARHGNVLAAPLAAGPVTVTIVSRGVELDQLRLVAVNDL